MGMTKQHEPSDNRHQRKRRRPGLMAHPTEPSEQFDAADCQGQKAIYLMLDDFVVLSEERL